MEDDNQRQFKPRGGRPKKEALQKRNKMQWLYLNQEESAKLLSMQQASDYSNVNDFIRAMLFEGTVKLYFVDKNREEIIRELGKIGGNINQIAKNMNQMKSVYNSVTDMQMEQINKLLKLLEEIEL